MLVLLLLAMLMPAASLSAQDLAFGFVRPGDRVRLRLPEPGTSSGTAMRVGLLARSPADSVSVQWESGTTTTIALSRIVNLEVSDGPQPFVARGMGYGFVAGALVGAVAGSRQTGNEYFPTPAIATFTSIVGGVGGAIVGGVVGAIGRRERWSTVQLDKPLRRMRVSPSLVRGSVALQGHVRF